MAQSLAEAAPQQRDQKGKPEAKSSVAHSLGEVARQQRNQKAKGNGKTLTNDDLSALPSGGVNQIGPEPAQKPSAEVGETSPAQRTSTGNPSAEKPTAGKSSGPQAFRYTVSWAPIPDVMNAAIFRFTVPALASGDGSLPLGNIEIVSNPCTKPSYAERAHHGWLSQPADPNPQLYANGRLHIYLHCLGLKKVGLARLIGQLSPTICSGACGSPVKGAGRYDFQATLGYYALHPTLASYGIEQNLETTGTLEIEPVSKPQ